MRYRLLHPTFFHITPPDAAPADPTGIDIYVRTNGVHTDVVLSAQSSERDWY